MNIKLIHVFSAGSLLMLSGYASAQTAFAVDVNKDLYSIDLPTATATLIGHTGQFLEGLAYDSLGQKLVGTDINGVLFSINPSTGAATSIGSTGLGNIEGLDYTGPGGLLYGTDYHTKTGFHLIDPSNASNILFTTTSASFGSVRAMCFNADVSRALLVGDFPNYQSLWSMDSYGNSTLIGHLNKFTAAIDYVGSDYWSLGDKGEVYKLDITTGAQTLVGNTGGQVWLDMAGASPAAVPEPATMALVGLGALGALRRRRKSQ